MPDMTIDGLGPLPILRPASVADVSDIVGQASSEDSALYPLGGGTMLDLGAAPTKKGRVIDLRSLDQVIDYPARDMTITVQTGITIARLQGILAPENQRLPIDVPQAERATLGGILATNTSGSRRFGYGTLRDYLLGFSAINDEGQEFKAGGRVVKNVAGYDLAKLMVGSLGTLGLFTQATLKLKPLPDEQAYVVVASTSENIEKVLTQVHATRTRPISLDILNRWAMKVLASPAGQSLPESAWVVLIGFEGSGEAVHWQVQQLVRELGTATTLQARIGSTGHGLAHGLAELPAHEAARCRFKASVVPSGVATFCSAIEAIEPEAMLSAHAGNGIVLGQYLTDLTQERAAAILKAWRDEAKKHRGRVIATRYPPAWKTPQLVWGPPADDTWLMRDIKDRFDPRRLFNPGRFVDGL